MTAVDIVVGLLGLWALYVLARMVFAAFTAYKNGDAL